MILTNCAVCAAPLAHDAPHRCVRCQLRYCSQDCQQHHWRRRGHEENCEIIHRGGDAEQYHAEKKYKWAVAVAVAKCAEDTKGQTCYICMEGIHPETNEGLVRGCACRGAAGFAHVSCLARQAQVLVADAEENSSATLDDVQEAVVTLWDAERIARRVFGDAHPLATAIEGDLRNARAALRAREREMRRAAAGERVTCT